MAKIQNLKKDGSTIYPRTHEAAVIDSNGLTLDAKMRNLTTNAVTTKPYSGVSGVVIENNLSDRVNKVEDKMNIMEMISNNISPEMFGAVGDGISDDSIAIQNTINYAYEHKTAIKLSRNKVYNIDNFINIYNELVIDLNGGTLLFNEKCFLVEAGVEMSRLYLGNGNIRGCSSILILSKAKNITIENITFDTCIDGISMTECSSVIMTNLSFSNITNVAIKILSSNMVSCTNMFFDGIGSAMTVSSSETGSFGSNIYIRNVEVKNTETLYSMLLDNTINLVIDGFIMDKIINSTTLVNGSSIGIYNGKVTQNLLRYIYFNDKFIIRNFYFDNISILDYSRGKIVCRYATLSLIAGDAGEIDLSLFDNYTGNMEVTCNVQGRTNMGSASIHFVYKTLSSLGISSMVESQGEVNARATVSTIPMGSYVDNTRLKITNSSAYPMDITVVLK